ncbi:MAG: TlyA family RNA methyltransferase [Clostridia bacterium]|nr:TlyA family RNA methyltransferase [Clostridia bacterium]
MRIDNELVNRGLFTTRAKAQAAIKDGSIYCNDKQINKNSFDVKDDDKLEIRGEVMPYVSRGGLKLEKAINVFNINLNGRVMIDIGSSTGGFTDVALRNGIKKVIAVDVGSDQMDPSLRNHPQVDLHEQTDFREMDNEILNDADFASIDVSFISVTKIIDKFNELPNLKEVVCLIKPQFECGVEAARKYKGVISDEKIHNEVALHVIEAFSNLNFGLACFTSSPIKGGDGNTEYLAHFIKGAFSKVSHSEISSVIKENF